MKKRTVVLVLATVLSLSVVGCGKSAEPKQEEAQQEEVEQGEQEAESTVIAENDVLVITGEEDRYSEYDLTVFTNSEAFGEEKTFNENSPVYSTDGVQVGYIKAGSTIKIDEALNLVWYCFKNPINGTDYDKLYVLQDYFSDSQDFSADAQEEEIQQEETPYFPENESDAFDNEILSKVGYDKDKTYTMEEYLLILEQISNEMEKEVNPELVGLLTQSRSENKRWDDFYINSYFYTYDFSNHEKMLEETKDFIYNLQVDPLGYDSIMEVYFFENEGAENNVVIIRKISTEVE